MNKGKLIGFICAVLAVVLVVLAFALPLYKTETSVDDYNGEDAVIAGSGGFLFRAYSEKTHAFADFKGEELLSAKEIDGHVSALSGLSERLAEKGYSSVFVFVPSKMSVYREKLPDNISGLYSKTRRYTQLCDAMKRAGADVIDVFSLFDGIKNDEQLYHTGSDALNEAGGYRLFCQIAEHLNEKYDLNIKICGISDYALEITEDATYPLTREYRNITGKTVPNRTLTLKEKTVLYTDANYDYEATKATEIKKENRSDGFDYPRFLISDTGTSADCFKFFSASSALSVYRSRITPDDAITDRLDPEYAIFIINEDDISSLPTDKPVIEVDKDVSAAPVIKATAYSDASHFVVFGDAEAKSTVTVSGGEEDVSVYTKDGEFVIEVPIITERERSAVKVKSKTDGKAESKTVELDVRYTKSHGNKGVVIGKEGHLHYQETIPDFTGESALPDETVMQYVGYLSAKADAIHEVSPNTKIIYVIPPNHLTIYPETAPDSLAGQKSDISRLSQLIEAFKDNDKVTFLDLKTPLLQAKETAPYRLYNKTDTHWNELGAYYAYREIMNFVSADFPAAAPDPLDDFDVFTKTVPGGDMANFLEVDLNTVTEEGVYVRAKNGLKSGISKDYSMNFSNAWFSDRHEFHIDDEELPTMIMYRDSFSTNLMSFLAEKFSHSVFHTMWEYPDEYDLIKEMQPDYIIIEHVERGLNGL